MEISKVKPLIIPKKPKSTKKVKKKKNAPCNKTRDIHVIGPDGNVQPCKGIKKGNGKLLIDDPHYTRRIIQIERKPDS